MKKARKIKWHDAIIYSAETAIPDSTSLMETTGFIEYSDATWTVVKNTKTINLKTGKLHPASRKATYFCIPSKSL